MNNRVWNTLLMLVGFSLLFVFPAAAQEFSADMVNRVGNKTTTSKIYVKPGKMRMEMAESIMIIRSDEKVSWVVMPAEKMYMEHPLDLSKAPKASKNFEGEIERISLGNETIDGQETEKFQVTYVEDGKNVSVYQWLKDGQVPVKVEAVDGSWGMEYKNLTVAPQPDELFEPPADYEKMEMPGLGDMMRGLMK